jgi:hypothetical protein
MTSRDFCFWLQGYFEIKGTADAITPAQADLIRRHLALVFKHEIDPSAGGPEHQAELNVIHDGAPKPPTPHGAVPVAPPGLYYRC